MKYKVGDKVIVRENSSNSTTAIKLLEKTNYILTISNDIPPHGMEYYYYMEEDKDKGGERLLWPDNAFSGLYQDPADFITNRFEILDL